MHQPPWHNSAWPMAMDRRLHRHWLPAGQPGRRRTDHRPCRQSVPVVASRVGRTNRTGPTTRWRRWWASPITCRPGRRRAPEAVHPARTVLITPRRLAVLGPHPEDLNTRQTPVVCILHTTWSPFTIRIAQLETVRGDGGRVRWRALIITIKRKIEKRSKSINLLLKINMHTVSRNRKRPLHVFPSHVPLPASSNRAIY